MSLKHYVFNGIQTKNTHPSLSPNGDDSAAARRRPAPFRRSASGLPVEVNVLQTHTNWLRKAWKFVSVEPVMICWLLPTCLLYIAIENLSLEKSCRVNFGYSDTVCDNMIDKSINGIDCVDVRSKLNARNYSGFEDLHLSAEDIEQLVHDPMYNVSEGLSELSIDVCRAEVDSQILDSELNVYTSPFDSVFGILMILFAGGWSDRTGRRKPCMIIPLVGELAALIVMLIATVFMKQLPLEFSSILMKLMPALAGGSNLMLIGVYSYLTEMTAEQDRTFRFGIFAAFVPLIPIMSVPFSGILFQKLRYINLILLCIPINLIGILYIVFVLKEKDKTGMDTALPSNAPSRRTSVSTVVATVDASADEAQRQAAADLEHERSYHMNGRGRRSTVHVIKEKIEQNCFLQFFNPIVAVGCVRVLRQRRPHNGRIILILLLLMYFIATGPAFGEEPNEYNFTRIKLNWDGLVYSPFTTYGNAVSLIGTLFMVGFVSKLFYISDSMVGFMGSLCSSVSRIMFATATTATAMYAARTVDMFVSVRAVTLKSIISTFVDNAELGRIFSIIGIIEAFGKFVFVSTYSIVYKVTLDSWPSAFYMVSFLCLSVTTVLFLVMYFLLKRRARLEAKSLEEATAQSQTDTVDIKAKATIPVDFVA